MLNPSALTLFARILALQTFRMFWTRLLLSHKCFISTETIYWLKLRQISYSGASPLSPTLAIENTLSLLAAGMFGRKLRK